MLKGDRATPSLILFSRVQRSWNCKNILCGRECTHHPKSGVWRPDYSLYVTLLELHHDLRHQKTSVWATMWRYSRDDHLASLIEHQCASVRRTGSFSTLQVSFVKIHLMICDFNASIRLRMPAAFFFQKRTVEHWLVTDWRTVRPGP